MDKIRVVVFLPSGELFLAIETGNVVLIVVAWVVIKACFGRVAGLAIKS
jgi:hypothetical protein